jgi:hypothetical protein
MYLPPDIIDNDANGRAEALMRTVRDLGQQRLDVATGYFAPVPMLACCEPQVNLQQCYTVDRKGCLLPAVAGASALRRL